MELTLLGKGITREDKEHGESEVRPILDDDVPSPIGELKEFLGLLN